MTIQTYNVDLISIEISGCPSPFPSSKVYTWYMPYICANLFILPVEGSNITISNENSFGGSVKVYN